MNQSLVKKCLKLQLRRIAKNDPEETTFYNTKLEIETQTLTKSYQLYEIPHGHKIPFDKEDFDNLIKGIVNSQYLKRLWLISKFTPEQIVQLSYALRKNKSLDCLVFICDFELSILLCKRHGIQQYNQTEICKCPLKSKITLSELLIKNLSKHPKLKTLFLPNLIDRYLVSRHLYNGFLNLKFLNIEFKTRVKIINTGKFYNIFDEITLKEHESSYYTLNRYPYNNAFGCNDSKIMYNNQLPGGIIERNILWGFEKKELKDKMDYIREVFSIPVEIEEIIEDYYIDDFRNNYENN